MKRLLVLALSVVLLSACKKETPEPGTAKTSEDPAATTGTGKAQLTLFQSALFTPKSHETVVINDDGNLENWLQEVAYSDTAGNSIINKDLVYAATKDLRFIDLALLPNYKEGAKWLVKYSNLINFKLTGMYVENDHKIHHPELIPLMYDKPLANYKHVIDCKDLRQIIGQHVLSNGKYTTYVEFMIDANIFAMKFHAEYDDKDHRFSIPMINSIFEENDLKDGDQIAFGTAYEPGHENDQHFKFTYMWVVKNKAFYNYSTQPR